jgi:hypothetical protein
MKKHCLIALLSIVHIISFSQLIVFEDHFDDNRNNWFVSSDRSITKGKLVVSNTSEKPLLIEKTSSLGENENFSFQATFKNCHDFGNHIKQYGLYCNSVPFVIQNINSDNKSELDTLKIERMDENLKIYLNGKLVGNYPFDQFAVKSIGIYVSKLKTVEIDDFVICKMPSRGLPPNLFAELSFDDHNHNGILESQEEAQISMKITNHGKGIAWNLEISIKDSLNDAGIKFPTKTIPYLSPESSVNITLPIYAEKSIKTQNHKLLINVREYNGYDMDPAYLVINTYAYQPPELVLAGLEIIDDGDDNAAINIDGQLQAGELITAKISIQNIGQIPATGVKYSIKSSDLNIFLNKTSGDLGSFKIGEVKDFYVQISPNKRVNTKDKLPIYLSLENNENAGGLLNFQVPLYLNQKPPEVNILAVNSDVESLKKEVARFEYNSKKFTSQPVNVMNIKSFTPSKTIRKNSIAVIFGVRNYNELPSAPYADNDALLMKEYFSKALGIEQIIAYTNSEVSGFIFDNVFNPDNGELQKAIIKGETELFVYYSGHGIPDKTGENTFLLPSDGKISRLETQGYNIETLYENLNKLGAKSVTVILDACFSGASRSSEKIKTENLIAQKGIKVRPKKPWLNNPTFTVINSSTGEETSLGYDASESGLFTYFFCLGLQGKADINNDKVITLGELNQYVTSNVVSTSKKISGIQTPEFYGDETKVLAEF